MTHYMPSVPEAWFLIRFALTDNQSICILNEYKFNDVYHWENQLRIVYKLILYIVKDAQKSSSKIAHNLFAWQGVKIYLKWNKNALIWNSVNIDQVSIFTHTMFTQVYNPTAVPNQFVSSRPRLSPRVSLTTPEPKAGTISDPLPTSYRRTLACDSVHPRRGWHEWRRGARPRVA